MRLLNSFFLIMFAFFMYSSHGFPCTGIQLKAKDDSYINGRTVEFGIPLDISAIIIPRNYSLKGTLPDKSTSFTYKTKYAALGGTMFGSDDIADGINEKGLVVGDFYFQNYASYAVVSKKNRRKALSPTEFSTWLLTQFANVDEVKENLSSVVIVPTIPEGWPILPPLHYVVYDKQGKSIVIEPLEGKFMVHDNPIGVVTNSPTFDWHLTNLGNYVNLSTLNASWPSVIGNQFKQFGLGSGLHGLPGDFTSPSRFIRAAFFSASALPLNNASETVFQMFHILNQFDIPKGTVRDILNDSMIAETTIVTLIKDPTNLKYYFKTYEDQTIKVITLTDFDLNAKEIKTITINGIQTAIDISRSAKTKRRKL